MQLITGYFILARDNCYCGMQVFLMKQKVCRINYKVRPIQFIRLEKTYFVIPIVILAYY